ncbi:MULTISPECIES: fimbrial protein [Klebsiella]|uniref:fimbrial protein n=1 Tax=Klebsiella TaxID=570 RepID=UPI00062C6D5D|nr:fimbrial protein [Klebsiella michiganensis]ELN3894509.1 fimbrial protein [Klebsiella michiganensis]ELS5413800.1 fimbrial protein [Klebsiella michiganensis]KKY71839.1 fimbrial protein [Klebsiella michiganensis]MBZ7106611.1 fimbrial protein [Klebsiella michiganensis]MCW9621764.1 fimbrial protein [Klebsiella michiganensis]
MKPATLFFPLLMTLAGVHSASADDIDSGQVELDMTGTIVAESCDIDTASQNQTIHIGDFSAGIFQSVGDASEWKQFDIKLNNCTSAISQSTVAFSGTADGTDPSLLALSDTSGGGNMASGVAIELLDSSMNTIAINSTDNAYPITQGNNDLTFRLRYKATAVPVTPGNASSVLYFDVSYQ